MKAMEWKNKLVFCKLRKNSYNLKEISNSVNISDYKNRYIITWMMHQIFMYSDKVMLVAG